MTKEKCVLSLEYTDNFFIVSLRIRQTQYKVDSSDNNLLDDKSNNTPKDSNVNIWIRNSRNQPIATNVVQ